MDTRDVPTQYSSPESLGAWAEAIEKEIGEIAAEMMPLQQRLDAARERLDLVRRLIHLTGRGTPRSKAAAETGSPSIQQAALPDIEDRIEEVLRARGEPTHIREIRASLIERGVPLPGRGNEANIILRLRRASDRFVRTERGVYGLTSWDFPEYSPPSRKKKVRRRKARRTAKPRARRSSSTPSDGDEP